MHVMVDVQKVFAPTFVWGTGIGAKLNVDDCSAQTCNHSGHQSGKDMWSQSQRFMQKRGDQVLSIEHIMVKTVTLFWLLSISSHPAITALPQKPACPPTEFSACLELARCLQTREAQSCLWLPFVTISKRTPTPKTAHPSEPNINPWPPVTGC